MDTPKHWFRSIHSAGFRGDISNEPNEIEYLKMWTGETFIHSQGTAYWDDKNKCLDIKGLLISGITHYRVLK